MYDRKLLVRTIAAFAIAVLFGIFTWKLYSMPGEEFLVAFAIIGIAGIGLTWWLQLHKQKD